MKDKALAFVKATVLHYKASVALTQPNELLSPEANALIRKVRDQQIEMLRLWGTILEMMYECPAVQTAVQKFASEEADRFINTFVSGAHVRLPKESER